MADAWKSVPPCAAVALGGGAIGLRGATFELPGSEEGALVVALREDARGAVAAPFERPAVTFASPGNGGKSGGTRPTTAVT